MLRIKIGTDIEAWDAVKRSARNLGSLGETTSILSQTYDSKLNNSVRQLQLF